AGTTARRWPESGESACGARSSRCRGDEATVPSPRERIARLARGLRWPTAAPRLPRLGARRSSRSPPTPAPPRAARAGRTGTEKTRQSTADLLAYQVANHGDETLLPRHRFLQSNGIALGPSRSVPGLQAPERHRAYLLASPRSASACRDGDQILDPLELVLGQDVSLDELARVTIGPARDDLVRHARGDAWQPLDGARRRGVQVDARRKPRPPAVKEPATGQRQRGHQETGQQSSSGHCGASLPGSSRSVKEAAEPAAHATADGLDRLAAVAHDLAHLLPHCHEGTVVVAGLPRLGPDEEGLVPGLRTA